MNDWIKASKKLPPCDKAVLGFRKGIGFYICAVMTGDYTDDGRPSWSTVSLALESETLEVFPIEYDTEWPTNWMTLPEPPRTTHSRSKGK